MTIDTDPRITPLDDAHWPAEAADMRGGFASGLNVYRTMAHHPALLRAWAPLREHIVHQTTLGPELSEVVILRTGHRLGSSYEWQQHIERARQRGLSDARIASIAGPPEAMAALDATLAKAVDELFDRNKLSDESVANLIDAFGNKAIFDLIATVGFYAVLGYTLNTFDVPLDDDVAEALRHRPFSPGGG